MEVDLVDEALFLRLQALANLRLPPEEARTLRPQLEQIVAFVRQLETLEGCAPDGSRGVNAGALREDLPEAGLDVDAALAAAPDAEAGLFRVAPAFGPESP
jgi:aspartyl/glutamyl-tRNA(Asn/Gln) amidotransferase C subunit